MTVYVVHLELILYTPSVIAMNNTTPANLTLGAQTFVNLDNDDQDTYFDNDALESSSNGVNPAAGDGDDELVRAELRVTPIGTAMLPSNLARLIATSGAANIKVWKNNLKLGSEYVLNSDFALTPQSGGVLTADLWIEGVSAHKIQKGTKLKMSYQGIDCMTSVSLTIIGVEKLSWEGVGNSNVSLDVLDTDPNYVSPNPLPATWPSAVRVFPDARAPNYTTPLNVVRLVVTLTVAPVEPVVMYVRPFDVDDPTNNTTIGIGDPNFLAFVDPNDNSNSSPSGFYDGTNMTVNYTNHEDNRTTATKAGAFAGQVGNTASISFFAGVTISRIDFPNVSTQPGDNYRVVVNGDKDFLNDLENLDHRDGHKIVDKNVLLPGPNPLEILKGCDSHLM